MNKEKRRTALDRFADAFRGVWHCMKNERNMRFHLTAILPVFLLAARLQLARSELAVLCVTVSAVLAMETMNTALERLCDYVEPKFSRYIGIVKDLAAGAVVLTAIGAVGVGCVLFLRPALWDVLCALFTTPREIACVVGYLVAAALFVRGKR